MIFARFIMSRFMSAMNAAVFSALTVRKVLIACVGVFSVWNVRHMIAMIMLGVTYGCGKCNPDCG